MQQTWSRTAGISNYRGFKPRQHAAVRPQEITPTTINDDNVVKLTFTENKPGNTPARRINTAKRATYTPTHHVVVPAVHLCQ
jgi:hypothetical protein